MAGTELVPLGFYQHCAMASIAYVERRRSMGRNLGELAYAKAFFRALTGKAQISSSDVRQVDASYDPSVRGVATKMDYIRAIDLLIDTRGETFTLPLSWSVAVAMFPGLQNRVTQRRDHRERIMELRDQRKTTSHSQSKEISFHTAKAISSQRLNFCRPGEHKQWLRDWHDEIHGQCLRDRGGKREPQKIPPFRIVEFFGGVVRGMTTRQRLPHLSEALWRDAETPGNSATPVPGPQ